MKYILLVSFLFSFTLNQFAQDNSITTTIENNVVMEQIKWVESFEKAQKRANKKNKPLLVFFTGSDWCGPCKILHKDFFESEKFAKIANNNLILYKADYPRRTDIISPEKKKKNNILRSKFGVRGFPTVILFDSEGKEIGRLSGYSSHFRDPSKHFNLVDKAIQERH